MKSERMFAYRTNCHLRPSAGCGAQLRLVAGYRWKPPNERLNLTLCDMSRVSGPEVHTIVAIVGHAGAPVPVAPLTFCSPVGSLRAHWVMQYRQHPDLFLSTGLTGPGGAPALWLEVFSP
jgi:hypothetical protein